MSLFDRPRGSDAVPRGYVTDGRRLLFAELVPGRAGREPVVVLEDCSTLEVIVCRSSECWGLGLRPVAGPSAAA